MQTPNCPLVSIALCTYNGEKFLSRLLESIVNQSYRNIEIIITDDCSVDNTWSILEIYREKDSRIKLNRNEKNLGYIKNFEKTILSCTGTYIALADQDDIWLPDKITVSVENIKNNILVYHDSNFIDENDAPLGTESMSTRYNMYDGDSCLPFILSNCVSGHASLFNADIKKYIFPFNGQFYHDWWLAYVAFNVGTVKYIDKILVHYRQHNDSITDNLKLRNSRLIDPAPVRGTERISLDLEWLKYCADYKYNRYPDLIKEAYYLFSNLAQGKKRVKSFHFLLKHFDMLFYICYKPKRFLSKINMIRKICFN